MTVLCLVELDGGVAADASLRALAFSRDLAASTGSGQHRAGQHRAGQHRAGQHRAGQHRAAARQRPGRPGRAWPLSCSGQRPECPPTRSRRPAYPLLTRPSRTG